jgi:hypothetical protein
MVQCGNGFYRIFTRAFGLANTVNVSRIILLILTLVAGLSAFAQVQAQTDISVELTAQPSSGLVPGQPIVFTLSATNHGPLPVDDYTFAIFSSDIYNEFDPSYGSTDCQGYAVFITDGDGFSYATISWSPTFLDLPALEVGETRSCHITLALSISAPAVWSFSFGVAEFFDDINPSNNVSTVILRRGDVAPVAVPVLSLHGLMLLGFTLASMAWAALRARGGLRVTGSQR